jgi:hypothetical protein
VVAPSRTPSLLPLAVGPLVLALTLARPARAEAPPSAARTNPVKLPVQLTVAADSARDDLTLYVQRGVVPLLGAPGESKAPLEPVCRAPCAFEAPFGLRSYGVQVAGHPLQLLDRELALAPGDALALRYRSRTWVRISGLVVLIAGASASSALLGIGATRDSSSLTLTGGVLSGVSVLLGLIMGTYPDRVSGTVTHH